MRRHSLVLALLVPAVLATCQPQADQEAVDVKGAEVQTQVVSRLRAHNAQVVVAVDDMVCSSCVQDLVNGINASCGRSFALVTSTGNEEMVKAWLDRNDVPVFAYPTATIQRTFPSDHSLAIYEWRVGAYVSTADVYLQNSADYSQYLAQMGCE